MAGGCSIGGKSRDPVPWRKRNNGEGGFRVPLLLRWPGVIKPGTVINDMIAHMDWMPTLLAAAGDPNLKEELRQGHKFGAKTFNVALDGFNFLPFFKGEATKGPRQSFLYFDQDGNLNAIRWNDWKVSFTIAQGNIATAVRQIPGWPMIVNLRADPYERAPFESGMYIRWYADLLWLFVPVQQQIQALYADYYKYSHQDGASLNAAGINYQSIKLKEALSRIQSLEESPINPTD